MFFIIGNFLKKDTPTQVVSREFCKSFKETFFIEHLISPCNYVLKTSWKTKKCYTEDLFTKTNISWVDF